MTQENSEVLVNENFAKKSWMGNTRISYSCVSMKEIQTYEIGGGIQLQFSYKIPQKAKCTCAQEHTMWLWPHMPVLNLYEGKADK